MNIQKNKKNSDLVEIKKAGAKLRKVGKSKLGPKIAPRFSSHNNFIWFLWFCVWKKSIMSLLKYGRYGFDENVCLPKTCTIKDRSCPKMTLIFWKSLGDKVNCISLDFPWSGINVSWAKLSPQKWPFYLFRYMYEKEDHKSILILYENSCLPRIDLFFHCRWQT